MKRFFYLLIFFLFLISQGCQQGIPKKPHGTEENKNEYYPDGKLKTSTQTFKNTQIGPTIFYYPSGVISGIDNYKNGIVNGEVFDFYQNGSLKQKSMIKDGVMDGYSYAFYPNGVMKFFRKWVKGKKEGYGEDYWESGDIKAVYFSKNDTLIYKRFFDSLGYVIETKGTPPKEKNPKVN